MEPSDVFFFTLISTHNYIFLYLIFVITVVSWLLFIILYNFMWGKFSNFCFFCNFSFSKNFYFFFDFCLFFFRASFYFWIMYFVLNFNNYLLSLLNKNGFILFRDIKSVVEYFLENEVKSNNYYKLLFFVAGHFCIVRGFYHFPYDYNNNNVKVIKDFKLANFLVSEHYYSKELDSLNKISKSNFTNRLVYLKDHNNFFIQNFDNLFFLRLKQKKQKFVLGRIFTRAFALTEKKNKRERFFSNQKWRHSLKIEIFWAVAPTIIVGIILIPSLVLLYSSAVIKYADHFLLITANQWFWNYQSGFYGVSRFHFFFFPSKSIIHFTDIDKGSIFSIFNEGIYKFFLELRFDNRFVFEKEKALSFFHNLQFDSYILDEGDLSLNSNKRLYDTDVHSVNPSLMALKMTISSLDVLHSFSLPSLGIKVDAVLGRINDFVTFVAKETLLMGQCSELCGSGHAFMPIFLEIMNPFDFYTSREEEFWRFLDFKGNCPLYNLKDDGIDEKLLDKEELNFNYKLYSFKKNIIKEF